jgi:uncharacterized protein
MIKATIPSLKATPGGHINTQSGRQICLLVPSEDTIEICDIAGALSLICRFGGQTSRFYSVAQHSLLVAALAPEDLKREALMHDASEAYLGDVILPVKRLISEAYSPIEQQFTWVINQKFGIDFPASKAIKEFDLLALELEYEALVQGDATRLVATMQRKDMIIAGSEAFYQPVVAQMAFLKEFNNLFPNHAIKELNGTSGTD